MSKQDEKLISEAYKQVLSEGHGNMDSVQTIVELFKGLGWTARRFNDGTGIAAKLDGEDGEDGEVEFDIFFYANKDAVNFYAHAKMPWDANVQINDVHIPILGQDEYSLPIAELATKAQEVVKIVIDEVLAANLPEAPSENDIKQHNTEQKDESRFRDRF